MHANRLQSVKKRLKECKKVLTGKLDLYPRKRLFYIDDGFL